MARRVSDPEQNRLPQDLPATRLHRRRARLILYVLLTVFTAISLHVVVLHLSPDPKLIEEERWHEGETQITIQRGRIFDSEGSVLAADRQAPSVWANPRMIDDPYIAAQRLSVLLNMDEQEIFDRLVRKTSTGERMVDVPIKRWLTEAEFAALGDIEKSAVPGVFIRREPIRYYPEETLAAHVLGYVNRERQGSEGIEAICEESLRSVPGMHRSRVDRERNILSSLTLEYVPPTGGSDVYLTIEKGIQSALERELKAVMERCQSNRAMGLIMDPKTGAILAMASFPTFDPNAYWEYSAEARKNRAVTDVFEPGSSFKIVTASAALEKGVITPDTVIDCMGGAWMAHGRRRITDVHKMGVEPFSTVFANSSNIGIIQVADKLEAAEGPNILDIWIQRFGFGQTTGRDFLSESKGIYRPFNKWSKFSFISLPMGQEVAVTMPQLARAFSAVANGGVLVEPHLVEHIVNRDGQTIYRFTPGAPERIISEQTSATMRWLCYQVVAHGTGQQAAIKEFRAGGKTGTGQVAKPDGRGYFTDQHTAVFAGYAPLDDPRVCAVIVVQNPQSKIYYGGYVCGPVFRVVVRETLIRLNCPEDPMGDDYPKALNEEPDADVVVAQSAPAPETQTATTEIAAAESAAEPATAAEYQVSDGPALPSFRGMTKRQAQEKLATLGVPWEAQGSGWVVAQEPAPGTALSQVDRCRLVFSNKLSGARDDLAGSATPASL